MPALRRDSSKEPNRRSSARRPERVSSSRTVRVNSSRTAMEASGVKAQPRYGECAKMIVASGGSFKTIENGLPCAVTSCAAWGGLLTPLPP